MILFLSRGKQSTLRAFAKELSGQLNTKVVVVDEGTNLKGLSKRDITAVLVESRAVLSDGKRKELIEKIRKEDVTVVFKDCDATDLKGFVAVAPEGEYVIVQNAQNGRRQLVVLLDSNPPEITVDKPQQLKGEVSTDQVFVTPPIAADVKTPKAEHPKVKTTAKSAMTGISASNVAQYVTDDRFHKLESTNETTYYWEHHTTFVIVPSTNYQPTIHPDYPQYLADGSTVTLFAAVHIKMYATKNPYNKYVQFKMTDAIGTTPTLGYDGQAIRGFFNSVAKVNVWPGTGNDPSQGVLPSGWVCPYFEPHTPNNVTSYTSTTGWSVGVTGGGSKDGPSAEVTASYDQSSSVTKQIQDFGVRNRSNGSMNEFEFYYTRVDGNNWEDHFYYQSFWGYAVSGLADLAKSTLTCNSECVYEAPASDDGAYKFKVRLSCLHNLLHSDGSAFHKHVWIHPYNTKVTSTATLDLSLIQNPQL